MTVATDRATLTSGLYIDYFYVPEVTLNSLPALARRHKGCAMTHQTHTIAESNNFIVLDKYIKAEPTGDSYQSESDWNEN